MVPRISAYFLFFTVYDHSKSKLKHCPDETSLGEHIFTTNSIKNILIIQNVLKCKGSIVAAFV